MTDSPESAAHKPAAVMPDLQPGTKTAIDRAEELYMEVQRRTVDWNAVNDREASLIVEFSNDALQLFGTTNHEKKIALRAILDRAVTIVPPKTLSDLKAKSESYVLTKLYPRGVGRRRAVFAFVVAAVLLSAALAFYKQIRDVSKTAVPAPDDAAPVSSPRPLNKTDTLAPLPYAQRTSHADRPLKAAARPGPVPPARQLERLARYGAAQLATDRVVTAILEIDAIIGMARPEFVVTTNEGRKSIEDFLAESGVNVELRWSDELPPSLMGSDGMFDRSELHATMTKYSSRDDSAKWHFYIVLAPAAQHGVREMLFDDVARRGGLVVTNGSVNTNVHELVWSILHEIGHELNLPHPFQSYGDTRSVMTYSNRWPNWSYNDASVYRFDAFGQHHIRRAPEQYVRPGQSAFLVYGAKQDWTALIR